MKKHSYTAAIVFLGFIILTAAFLSPLPFNMKTHIPGFASTDEPFGIIWRFWLWAHTDNSTSVSAYTNLIAYPLGIAFDIASTSPVWVFVTKWLSAISGEIVAYNIEIMLSFLLSGIFMYFLVFYLTKNIISGVLSGIIYAFCPYHFARSWQHIGLSQIQWIPLFIYALVRLRDKRCVKNALWVGLAFFLICNFDYYYA